MFIEDVFDLMAFNAKEVNYYEKYSYVVSSLIIFFVAMAFHFAMPIPSENWIASFSFTIILYFLAFIIAALVLRLWLEIKNIYVSFTCLYNLMVLASVIDILVLPIALLDGYLNSAILLGLNVILFIYSFAIIISAVSKSAQAGLGFVFVGIFFTIIVVSLAYSVAHIVAVVTGVLHAPEPFTLN
jgi:hypothetical protein